MTRPFGTDSFPIAPLSRRTFLVASSVAGGGLLLSATIPAFGARKTSRSPNLQQISIYARIAESGVVTIAAPNQEMGQGTKTALPIDLQTIWVALDIGRHIFNPLNAEHQVQGAIMDGLSASLYQQITLDNGQVKQGNFNDYRQQGWASRLTRRLHQHYATPSSQPPGNACASCR